MSLNQCQFIGNLGADPEIRHTQSGDKIANLRLAVTEKWTGKDGQKNENTEWISVTMFGGLAKVAESYLRKGSKVFISGRFKTRKWQDQTGNDRYSTEIVCSGPGAIMEMLDGPRSSSSETHQTPRGGYDHDSEIPF